jgi:hypothetical protein
MSAIDAARSHAATVVADLEAMLAKAREHLTTIEAEVANEAAKIPTMEDVRALVARVPAA